MLAFIAFLKDAEKKTEVGWVSEGRGIDEKQETNHSQK